MAVDGITVCSRPAHVKYTYYYNNLDIYSLMSVPTHNVEENASIRKR